MLIQNIATHALTMQQLQPHAMGLGRHGLAGLLDHEDYQPAEYNGKGATGMAEILAADARIVSAVMRQSTNWTMVLVPLLMEGQGCKDDRIPSGGMPR